MALFQSGVWLSLPSTPVCDAREPHITSECDELADVPTHPSGGSAPDVAFVGAFGSSSVCRDPHLQENRKAARTNAARQAQHILGTRRGNFAACSCQKASG